MNTCPPIGESETTPSHPRAFTLIELLVVITIIVVLLALLTPALDRAIYQAELIQCASRLRAVATGVTDYALAQRRSYPARWAVPAGDQPTALADNLWDTDDRPYFVGFFDVNLLLDPFLPEVDLEVNDDDLNPDDDVKRVYAHYAMWWGWRFDQLAAQDKMGRRFAWRDESSESRFDVLIGDYDEQVTQNPSYYSTHPDREGQMFIHTYSDDLYNWTRWTGNGGRGHLDLNFAHQDLSVRRSSGIGIDEQDDRLIPVPQTSVSGSTWPQMWYSRLPQ